MYKRDGHLLQLESTLSVSGPLVIGGNIRFDMSARGTSMERLSVESLLRLLDQSVFREE